MAFYHTFPSKPVAPAPAGFSDRLSRDLDWYFAGLGLGINPHLLVAQRRDVLCRLDQTDDVTLLCFGITRADIPRYVFRDLFG